MVSSGEVEQVNLIASASGENSLSVFKKLGQPNNFAHWRENSGLTAGLCSSPNRPGDRPSGAPSQKSARGPITWVRGFGGRTTVFLPGCLGSKAFFIQLSFIDIFLCIIEKTRSFSPNQVSLGKKFIHVRLYLGILWSSHPTDPWEKSFVGILSGQKMLKWLLPWETGFCERSQQRQLHQHEIWIHSKSAVVFVHKPTFLDATMHLYKRLCLSVGVPRLTKFHMVKGNSKMTSECRSVGLSVLPRKKRKRK